MLHIKSIAWPVDFSTLAGKKTTFEKYVLDPGPYYTYIPYYSYRMLLLIPYLFLNCVVIEPHSCYLAKHKENLIFYLLLSKQNACSVRSVHHEFSTSWPTVLLSVRTRAFIHNLLCCFFFWTFSVVSLSRTKKLNPVLFLASLLAGSSTVTTPPPLGGLVFHLQ